MSKIKSFIANILINYPRYFINSLVYIFYRRTILVNAFVEIRYGKVMHRNWGDDINVYLLEKISQKKVVIRNQSLFHWNSKFLNFICIGSILGLYENQNSIIWGAGFISDKNSLLTAPKRICSVRGKYTRELLIKAGYECPAVYGDPALLISKFYNPLENNKRYRIGFILHYVDENNPMINSYVKEFNDCILISLSRYVIWTEVVDKICSCDFIISSSLHGLIVSDSYGIPNVWVRLSDCIIGGYFKYYDYFSSVNRTEEEPYAITSFADVDRLYEGRFFYELPSIDYESIINSCPFKY